MTPVDKVAPGLRALLVLVVAGLLAAQGLLLPVVIEPLAARTPWVEDPFLLLGVLGLACGQAVVVCTWRLLGLAATDQIFTSAATPWVEAIVRFVAAAAVLLAATAGVLAAAGAPVEVPAALVGASVLAVALDLLVLVLRTLLHRATTLRADLDEVI